MKAHNLARFLGWFSIGLGLTEIAAPATVAGRLGLENGTRLVRVFGLREVLAGMFVLMRPASPAGLNVRAAGDAMDLAVLTAALTRSNDRRGSAALATAMVVGVTLLDIACAAALSSQPGFTRGA